MKKIKTYFDGFFKEIKDLNKEIAIMQEQQQSLFLTGQIDNQTLKKNELDYQAEVAETM